MTTLAPGKYAYFPVVGRDSSGSPAPITGTALISDYSKAYVAIQVGGGLAVVPKIPAPDGGTYTFSVTVSGEDVDGTDLPPVVKDYLVQGNNLAPRAVLLELGTDIVGNIDTLHGTPEDPGVGTISF